MNYEIVLPSRLITSFLLVAVLSCGISLDANDATKKEADWKLQKKSAIAFVSKHHPELVPILKELESNSPASHSKAIKELHQAHERLARFKERDSQRYELELGMWKAKSRSQLLSAQLQMSDSEKIQKELRAVLAERAGFQLQLLKHERSLAEKRLEKIDASIEKLEQNKDASIEKWMQSVSRSKAARRKPEDSLDEKPVSKKNPTDTKSKGAKSEKKPADKKKQK